MTIVFIIAVKIETLPKSVTKLLEEMEILGRTEIIQMAVFIKIDFNTEERAAILWRDIHSFDIQRNSIIINSTGNCSDDLELTMKRNNHKPEDVVEKRT